MTTFLSARANAPGALHRFLAGLRVANAEVKTVVEEAHALSVVAITRTLTNDEIIAIPTTRQLIVPAPGIGKELHFLAGRVTLNAPNYVGYGNIGGQLMFQHNFANLSSLLDSSPSTGNLLTRLLEGDNYDRMTAIFAPAQSVGGLDCIPIIWNDDSSDNDRDALFHNQPLYLNYTNSGTVGNLSGGDPENTMRVKVIVATVDR